MSRQYNLQDDCWDQVCPFAKHGNIKEKKEACFHDSAKAICNCCRERNLPDCKVLVPGRGLLEVCKENNSSSYKTLSMYNGERYNKSTFLFTGSRGWDN